jgi:hypothetical protein
VRTVQAERRLRAALDEIACRPAPSDARTFERDLGPRESSLLETADALRRTLAVPPPAPPNGLQESRQRFLARAAQPTTSPLPQRSSRVGRLLPALNLRLATQVVVAALLVLMSGAPLSREIVRAASTSVPGQVLYPLKIHVERVQVAGADQPDTRVALALAFLGERVAETQALLHRQAPLRDETRVEVQLLLNQLLRAVAETPDQALMSTLNYVAMQLEAHERVLESLHTLAPIADAQLVEQLTESLPTGAPHHRLRTARTHAFH